MQKRIDRLESLVTTLVAQGQGHSDTGKSLDNDNSPQSLISKPTLEDDQHFESVQHGMGVLEVNDKHSIYRGSTHWGEILEEVHFSASYAHHMTNATFS
jgi:hypothetical protein